MKSVALLAAASVIVGLAVPANAVTLNYSNFASTSGLQLNGSAASAVDASNRSVLRLTPSDYAQAGSTFSLSPITLSSDYSFSTAFTFNINNYGGINGGADGLVFAIQTVSNTAGSSGSGIGFEGLPNSLGVEFDTFNNGGGDPNDNHIAVDLNGDVSHGGASSGSAPVTAPYTLKSATDLTAYVDYNGVTGLLEVRLSNNGIRPLASLLSYSVNLASVLGSPNAYVGFTSATGSAYANHDIVNWQFNDSFAPIGTSDVPEPASWAMMVGGFGLLGAAMRRRSRPIAFA